MMRLGSGWNWVQPFFFRSWPAFYLLSRMKHLQSTHNSNLILLLNLLFIL